MSEWSTRGDMHQEMRRIAREDAAAAVHRWLNLEAETAPLDRLSARWFWIWPSLATAFGAFLLGTAVSGYRPPPELAFVAGALLSGGAATILERVRQRTHRRSVASMMARIAELVPGRTSEPVPLAPQVAAPIRPIREPQAPAAPEPPLPEPIAGLLERARSASAGIARLAADAIWTRTRVPVREHDASARAQLAMLEERARRLAMVKAMLAWPEGGGDVPGHLRDLAEVYRSHCEGLASAAEMFERAQASLARALLAVADGAPGAGAPEAALRDIGAAFDSLAQVLESLGGSPVPVAPAQPAWDTTPPAQVAGERLHSGP